MELVCEILKLLELIYNSCLVSGGFDYLDSVASRRIRLTSKLLLIFNSVYTGALPKQK